ncbi:MAG: hypothetical protein KAX10_08670 [Candidatus Lokiarchaeota archaeon]|nr:hypothetical protein [Candidatus Lokiarchaeota archaeon]
MSFEILELMKKKGFKDTLQILSKRKDYKINKHTFYKELNKFSYYNSFLRVKDILLNRDIIYVKKNKNKKLEISLTPKGVVILEKIEELNELFTKGDGII